MQRASRATSKTRTIEEDARSIDNACGVALLVSKHATTGRFFMKLKK
jgi:hypothetical protein